MIFCDPPRLGHGHATGAPVKVEIRWQDVPPHDSIMTGGFENRDTLEGSVVFAVLVLPPSGQQTSSIQPR